MYLRTARALGRLPQPGRLRCVASRSDDDGHTKTPSKRSEDLVRYALAGNLAIAGAKGAVALTTGSAAMLAETVHSCADAGNQALLLIGLHASAMAPSASHPYGYGKSVYLWSLVSALGTFWLGAGVALHASVTELMGPSMDLDALTRPEAWGVLAVSLAIDGTVLRKSVQHVLEDKPSHVSFLAHLKRVRDPTLLAVLCEDAAACAGIVVVAGGMGASLLYATPVYDCVAGIAVGGLLGGVGGVLAMLNGRYLIGAAVEQDVLDDVESLLRSRPSVDDVHAVRSQRLAPDAFAYKCEVDFDGTWVAAQLYDKYAPRFKLPSKKRREAEAIQQTEVPTLLSYFAEDVVRVVEREVRDIERAIRARHPDALFIEIEPDAQRRTGSSRFRFALDEGLADESKRSAEQRLLDSYLSEKKGVAEALPVNFAIKDGRVVRERRKVTPVVKPARLAGVAEDESWSYRKDGLT